jgi:hypothetical protein
LRSIRNSSVATAFGWATLMMTVRVRPVGLVQPVQLFAVDLLPLSITTRRCDDELTIAVNPTYGNELCLLVSSLMDARTDRNLRFRRIKFPRTSIENL